MKTTRQPDSPASGNTQHWSLRYHGLEWDAVRSNCRHFLQRVYSDLLGVDIGRADVDSDDAKAVARRFRSEASDGSKWRRVLHPKEFDAVAMGKRGKVHHVGIWTEADGGKVAHCNEGRGVAVMSLPRLAMEGYETVKFYRYADDTA